MSIDKKSELSLSLTSMAIDMMDYFINKPTSIIISDPKKNPNNNFIKIKENLMKKKIKTLHELKTEFQTLVNSSKDNLDKNFVCVADEFLMKFDKKFEKILQFNNFKFQTEMKNIIEQISNTLRIQKSDKNDHNDKTDDSTSATSNDSSESSDSSSSSNESSSSSDSSSDSSSTNSSTSTSESTCSGSNSNE